MDPKLSPGLSIAIKCSIVDPTGPLFYMSAKFLAFMKIGVAIIRKTELTSMLFVSHDLELVTESRDTRGFEIGSV